jgi:hypothetical protein
VGTTNATGNGNITSIGSENCTLRGVEWGTTPGVYTANATESGNFGVGAFTANITGLTFSTTYFYRALAQNSYGTDYGNEVSFTASPTTPFTVVTAGASGIYPTYATLQGTLTDMGSSNFTSVSFEYGTTSSYGSATPELQLTSIGSFSIQITGLSYNTLYHFRARARYGLFYSYGADATFTTLSAVGSTTDLRIISVAVFSNYLTTGDLLFAAEVVNQYSGYYPNLDPKRYFTIQLLDLNNTDVLGATPLPFWGDRPVSIYLRPAQATTLLEGGAYYIRMIGTLIVGTPSVEKQITEDDWYGYDFTGALDDWAKGVAINMEISDGRSDYLTNLTDQGTVITDAAGGYFTIGIQGIGQVRPNLFTTTVVTPQISVGTAHNIWDKPDADPTGWRLYVGANIASDMDTMAIPFGVTGKDFTSGLIGIAMLGCMMIVVGGTGGMGALGAILLALPILWLGFYFRIVPSAVIALVVIGFSLLAIRQFVVKTL